ncbi:hypothetical protein FRC10_008297 [Ceratobasidium sp. 414]|nr:hypothetical protein FRC10_008297 [Ceratobasidium sp. 414]
MDSQPSLADLESILDENMEKLRLDATEGINLSRSLAEHRQNLPDTLAMPCSGLQGMSEGDPGRMLEIMNVFLFAFWGTNSTNYGNELLKMICNFKYEYPPKMRQVIINNMLVNPSGLPKHWQAGDLLQEHHNLKIKTIYNTKSSDFDDSFLRESVSLNVARLSRVEESLMEQLGLARTDKRRALAKRQSDINVLGAHLEKEKALEFI